MNRRVLQILGLLLGLGVYVLLRLPQEAPARGAPPPSPQPITTPVVTEVEELIPEATPEEDAEEEAEEDLPEVETSVISWRGFPAQPGEEPGG